MKLEIVCVIKRYPNNSLQIFQLKERVEEHQVTINIIDRFPVNNVLSHIAEGVKGMSSSKYKYYR